MLLSTGDRRESVRALRCVDVSQNCTGAESILFVPYFRNLVTSELNVHTKCELSAFDFLRGNRFE